MAETNREVAAEGYIGNTGQVAADYLAMLWVRVPGRIADSSIDGVLTGMIAPGDSIGLYRLDGLVRMYSGETLYAWVRLDMREPERIDGIAFGPTRTWVEP